MTDVSYTRGSGLLEGFLAKKRSDKANSFIPKNSRSGNILDVGCGSYPYFLISTEFKQKYGVDPSVADSLVKEKNIFLSKIKIDDKKLPFKNDFFDVVTMLAVFEHIEHDKLINVLSEVKRVLKEGGIFIITTPAPWSDKLLHLMARTGLISKEEIHEHKHNQTKAEIEKVIKSAGFSGKNIKSGYFELGLNMWFLIKK